MSDMATIPALGFYGETAAFPDTVHCESLPDRAKLHDWRILPHRHGGVSQLFLVTAGRVSAHADGVQLTLCEGDFLYVPEHCVHEFHFTPDVRGDVISAPASVLASTGPNGAEVAAALSRPFAGRTSGTLEVLAAELRKAARTTSPFAAQRTVGLAHSVLATLAELCLLGPVRIGRKKPERLFALDRLIDAHMADGWTASDYAAALSITTGHLSRLCRSATGRGAAAYVERRLMTEACRMLIFTGATVAEIGYRLGYPDPSYFTRRFRRVRGLTPSGFRRQFTT
ncbi:MAG: helix-turn-helix domain-containing protein [Paracoccaceae bacterium]|nr:helix-turn-helix domain-containing protein [Paracoccaceae bacterium]